MTDPHQQNPWADPSTQPRQDPHAQPAPYGQPAPYAPPVPYAPPSQWTDPTTPASPPPFVSPDAPSYASGSSPVPMGSPAAPDYGYAQTQAPGYGYAAGYGGYGATPAYVPVMPQQKTNGMAIGAMVVSIVALPLVACYGGGGLLGIVGAILGHVARRQIRTSKESGDGMAMAGIIIGWISAALGLIVLGLIVAFIVYAVNTDPNSFNSGSNFDSGNGFNAIRQLVRVR